MPVAFESAACLRRVAGAGEVGAIGEDVHRDSEPRAVRREPERADVERQTRHLLGLAAGGGQSPHLRRAAARGDEVDVAAVARPLGRVVVLGMRREAARLRALGREIERPQVLAAAIRRHVGLAHREHDGLAVGRQSRIGHALQPDQVFDRERMTLGRRGGGADERERNPRREQRRTCRSSTADYVDVGVAQGLAVHGNQALALLARGLRQELFQPGTEVLEAPGEVMIDDFVTTVPWPARPG